LDEKTVEVAKADFETKVAKGIEMIGEAWSLLKTAIRSNTIVSSDEQRNTCVNTCAFMTTPLSSWMENQENPDRSALIAPEFANCPNNELGCTEEMGNPYYKLCLRHTAEISIVPNSKGAKTLVGRVEIDSACKARVDRINSCNANFRQGQIQRRYVESLLEKLTQATDTLTYTLEKVAILMISDAQYQLRLDVKRRELKPLQWDSYHGDIKATTKVTFKGEQIENCSDIASWLHLTDYKDGVLRKAPCTTKCYCDGCNDLQKVNHFFENSKYCDDSLRCDKIFPEDGRNQDFDTKGPSPQDGPNWLFTGPTYDYNALFKSKYQFPSSIF
jgi:hypothetical protein